MKNDLNYLVHEPITAYDPWLLYTGQNTETKTETTMDDSLLSFKLNDVDSKV